MKPSDELREIAEQIEQLRQRLEQQRGGLDLDGEQPAWKAELDRNLGRYSRGLEAAAKGLARESKKLANGDYKKPSNQQGGK